MNRPDSSMREARAPIPPVTDGGRRPRWSVMIPTFNCADSLRHTLASVLAQDPGPETMQIEVIDDASTLDDPESVVRELAPGRAGFFRQLHNVGHAENFNTCLRRARGHFVHLLHGDDLVRPGFYNTMAEAFDSDPAVGAAFCRFIAIDSEGNVIKEWTKEQEHSGILEGWLERIATGQRLQTPCMVVRRRVYEEVGGFDARAGAAEDWEMWVRIAARWPIWYEPRALACYRVSLASLSGKALRSGENVHDLRRIIEINRAYLPQDSRERITAAALHTVAVTAIRRGNRFLRKGDAPGAWAQFREAVRTSPGPGVLARALFAVVHGVLFHAAGRMLGALKVRRAGGRAPRI